MNLTDGTSFEGVIWQSRGPWIVLRDAKFLESGKEPTKVDGEVILERSRVAFYQMAGQ